jgi:predicted Ser/Thr protein kinase
MSESEGSQNMGKQCPQCGAPLPSGVLEGLCPACLFKQGAAADTSVPPETGAFQPPGLEEVARLFPQLEILAFIGKGGMGAVYKARQPALDRIVALKILPPETVSGSAFVERFNREARALAKLSHPNIVAVHEFGQVNGLPFFLMEFVDGLNLRQLEQAGKLSPQQALQIVPQICEALQFAHDEGIVHRDIKPENILMDKRGRVKIADFGIAKILGAGRDVAITETQGAIGTPHYMAPEQMEKPTTVDHRADIFSLGVVFYEMLTGELPLGKFAPPSSRRVEVDVRLDDVVLRALEKDPEMRYQKVSQVKTAVDTIATSVASAPAPMGDALVREVLARDYNLDIRSCLRRAWALVRSDFWPIVAVTALMLALLAVAGSVGSTVGINTARQSTEQSGAPILMLLVYGPLMGGLSLYYLKKIRGEPANVELAFSGFSNRFLHLFLGGFVTWALTGLGFICLILPGVYLFVAWWFTLTLIVDKKLDFWPAMELSRKVVTKHWWKLFGFMLVVLLVFALGLLVCGIGFFIAAPLGMIAATYAYEDMFGLAAVAAAPSTTGVGPSGTMVMPGVPPKLAVTDRAALKRALPIIGLAALAVVIAVIFISVAVRRHEVRWENVREPEPAEPATAPEPPAPPAPALAFIFSPVIERDIQARATGTNQFLDLDSEKLLTPPPDIAASLAASQPGEDEGRFWQGLDIADGSKRFKYINWLRESGADLMFAGDGKIIGFDGVFPMAHGDSSTNWDNWDSLTPEQVRTAVETVDWSRRFTQAQLHGEPAPPAPTSSGVHHFNSAAQLDSREHGGPVVNLLTRDQSAAWFFKTREGAMGVLQLASFTGDPSVARIRYKLVQQTNDQDAAAPDGTGRISRETLAERLDAASVISDLDSKDRALDVIATDAAKGGELAIIETSLRKMSDSTTRSHTAHESARILAKRGLRKQAIKIAKAISDPDVRDEALAELAQ